MYNFQIYYNRPSGTYINNTGVCPTSEVRKTSPIGVKIVTLQHEYDAVSS
jgi:hypothetical protein